MARDPNVVTSLTLTGDPIVEEARKFFDRCSEWESSYRKKFIDDIKFEFGDSENGYQWPVEKFNDRTRQSRPCLTMNMVNQHNKMISNQARKNKSSVKFLAMGNGATKESANVYQDIMRHIEHQSQAQTAYTIARGYQIGPGRGWLRVVTDYVDGSMDQEIFIEAVMDPLSVFIDPDCKKRDKRDAKKALVFDDMALDDFLAAYPKYEGIIADAPLGVGSMDSDWSSKDHVRVCEYFRKVPKKGKLVSLVHQGKRHTIDHDTLKRVVRDPEQRKEVLDDPQTRIRDTLEWEVEWYLIVGERIIDQTIWMGKYIPLIPVLGDETIINGQLDIKGHTRWMKDAQRMYNYNASAQVEFVALQGKTPWIVPVKAIEELESIWNTANTVNHSVLPYNHLDLEGGNEVPIPPPSRTEPPNASPAYQTGMDTAMQQIMLTSGQFQNQMGMMGNERTGAAIDKRQQQSDTAVFHFQDNYGDALVLIGCMVIDLVPHIYDTKRVMQIQGDAGVDYELEIDPTLREGFLQKQAHNNEVVKKIFNPNIGRFDIAPSVGPEYGSNMEETADALTLILTQAPGLTGIIGDLLMASLPFDKAQEAAARLRRMVPPVALGTGPSEAEQQLQAKVQALTTALGEALGQTAKDKLKLVGKDELRDIEVYDAHTKRIAAEAKLLPTDPEGLRQMIAKMVQESLADGMQSVIDANKPELDDDSPPPEPPPVPGANKAPDGEWYITDPTRKGKYLHIAPLAQLHSRPGIVG
jgi:Phage P22-like portal protein